MSTYRRATLQDLAKIGYVPNTQKYSTHIAFAKKYYPPEATTMVITVHSEYNDCTYDNSFQYIIVYDVDGNELPPLKKTAKECREHWTTEYLPIPNTHHGHYGASESEEPLEDVVIPLTVDIPELYIKES
jgi:hypothetical protein